MPGGVIPLGCGGIGAARAAQGREFHEDVVDGDPVGGQVVADGPGEHEMERVGSCSSLPFGSSSWAFVRLWFSGVTQDDAC